VKTYLRAVPLVPVLCEGRRAYEAEFVGADANLRLPSLVQTNPVLPKPLPQRCSGSNSGATGASASIDGKEYVYLQFTNGKVDLSSLREHPDGRITIDQLVDLQSGDDYRYLAVWDVTSHRLGTLHITLTVPNASQ
jgi:hypothetical protein